MQHKYPHFAIKIYLLLLSPVAFKASFNKTRVRIASIPIEKRRIPKISRPRLNKRSMSASDEGIGRQSRAACAMQWYSLSFAFHQSNIHCVWSSFAFGVCFTRDPGGIKVSVNVMFVLSVRINV